MNKRIIIQISGRVQGVWFRKFVKNKAIKLNLRGYTKNNADGSVTVKACGVEKRLIELAQWCKVGSPNACVNNINYVIDEGLCENNSFNIF